MEEPIQQPPIVIPPEVISLPTHQEVPNACSLDFTKPDHQCLSKVMVLDNPNDSTLLKIKDHYVKNKIIYDQAALLVLNAQKGMYYEKSELQLVSRLMCALNYREDDMSFDCCLHNGELLSNVNKYGTRLEPKGYGKGKNWDWAQAAHHAMMLKKSQFPQVWDLGSCLAFAEVFNGKGYRSKIGDKGQVELSPYVYAFTSLHDETGKYIADGKYSPTAPEKQRGVGSIMLILSDIA